MGCSWIFPGLRCVAVGGEIFNLFRIRKHNPSSSSSQKNGSFYKKTSIFKKNLWYRKHFIQYVSTELIYQSKYCAMQLFLII